MRDARFRRSLMQEGRRTISVEPARSRSGTSIPLGRLTAVDGVVEVLATRIQPSSMSLNARVSSG